MLSSLQPLLSLIASGIFGSSNDKPEVPIAHRLLTEDAFCIPVFDHCSARSLVLLLRTCRPVNGAVRAYIAKRFNVNRILDRYFSDAMSFRYLQARTGTLISGSSALQYFDRSFYPTSDLDLYVSRVWAHDVGQFLFQQGYQFCKSSRQHPTFDSALKERRVVNATAHYGNFKGIAAVFTFKKGPKGKKLKVQVMAAVRSPIEVVLRFHSTVVMNVIAFDRAYCLYPRATLDDRLSLVTSDRSDEIIENVYQRYTQRGWRFILNADEIPHITKDRCLNSRCARWIDDGGSWSIALPLPLGFHSLLPPLNRRTPSFSRDPVSATGWKLTTAWRNNAVEMRFRGCKSVSLFNTYVVADGKVLDRPSLTALKQTARDANAGWYSSDDKHYIDERFMELCEEYYRAVF